jgi:parallel beta-helix repeat protein
MKKRYPHNLLVGLILGIMFSLLASQVSAADWYVDANSGNDDYLGSSPDTAWRTISKVNSITFNPGDFILFKRGCVWREPLVVSFSGGQGSPITFGAYGEGAKPVINCAKEITGWELYAGGIYTADVDFAVGQLVVDNKRLAIAHEPNSGYWYSDTETETPYDSTGSDSFIYNTLIEEEIIGADIYIRTNHWKLEDRIVSGYADNTIFLNNKTTQTIDKNEGFILANKLWMLDVPGEWYCDNISEKLYLWLPDGSNPADYQVESSYYDYGIFAEEKNNVVIENIDIKNANLTGVQLVNVNSLSIRNLKIENSGQRGIEVDSSYSSLKSENVIISGCEISDSVQGGIRVDNWSEYINVENNIVTNTGLVNPVRSGLGELISWGIGAGIHIRRTGDYCSLRNNYISDSAYAGIIIPGTGAGTIAERNIINNSCLVLDDGGGIYSGPGDENEFIIRDNIISNPIGNAEGTSRYFTDQHTMAHGIYLDSRAHNISIRDNTIINASNLGIFLHNAYDNSIRGNVTYNNGAQLLFSEGVIFSQGEPGSIYGNTIEDNIFFSVGGQETVELKGQYADVNFGSFDNNTYAAINNDHLFYTHYAPDYPDDTTKIREYYDLAGWRDRFGWDINSYDVGEIFKVKPYIINEVLSDNLISNGTFDSDKSDWTDGWSNPSGLVHPTWVSEGGLDNGCLQSYTSRIEKIRGDILSGTSSRFEVKENKQYLLEFSVVCNTTDAIYVTVRSSGDPDYHSVGFNELVPVGPVRKDYSFVFTATRNQQKTRLDFHSGLSSGAVYWFDNVSLHEVDVSFNDPSDDSRIFINYEDTPQEFDLAGVRYLTLWGEEVSDSIIVAPFRSEILIPLENNFEAMPPDPFQLLSPSDDSVVVGEELDFRWDPSSDNQTGLYGYQLYIDGRLVISYIPAGQNSISLFYLLSAGVHTWYIAAIDNAGNIQYSDTAEITAIEQDTWYVRPAGGNYGLEDGTSYENAWNGFGNIVWGAGGVSVSDTLYVCGAHSQKLEIGNSGEEGNPISIRGDYPDAGIMDGRDITAVNKNYLVFQGLTFQNVNYYPLRIEGSHDVLIQGCSFTGLAGSDISGGVFLRGRDNYDVYDITICDCTFMDFNSWAICGWTCGTGNCGSSSGSIGEGPGEGRIYDVFVRDNSFSNVKSALRFWGAEETMYVSDGHMSPRNIVFEHNNVNKTTHCWMLSSGGWVDSYIGYNNFKDSGEVDKPNVNGLQINWARNVIIEHNVLDGVQTNIPDGSGLILDWGNHNYEYPSDNCIVRYNIVRNCKAVNSQGVENGKGIYVYRAKNCQIYNNIIYDCTKGIALADSDSTGNVFYNNTVYNCTKANAVIQSAASLSIWKNNIFSTAPYGILLSAFLGLPTVPLESNNCFYDHSEHHLSQNGSVELPLDSTDITGQAPLFVDISGGDFHLLSNSPCIDKGVDAGLVQDFEGNPVPQGPAPDIGAYEYVLQGDLNGDGRVNNQDIQACVNHILGTQTWAGADVNRDTRVDVLDIRAIVDVILGV